MRGPDPSIRRTRSRFGVRGSVILALALAVVVVVALRPLAADPVVSADTLSIWLGALAAMCCCATALRTHGALRRSWLLIGTTMTM